MGAPSIPDNVRRFLLASIPSVPHLEALLLLRAEPAVRWCADTLSRRLYVTTDAAARLLGDLEDAALAVRTESDGYGFAAGDAALVEVVEQLDAVYSRHVVAIAELIHSSADRKAHRFAGAFRWRKES